MGTSLMKSPVVLDEGSVFFNEHRRRSQLLFTLNQQGVIPSAVVRKIIVNLKFTICPRPFIYTAEVSAMSLGLPWNSFCQDVLYEAMDIGFKLCPWSTGFEFCLKKTHNLHHDAFIRVASEKLPTRMHGNFHLAVSNFEGQNRLVAASAARDARCEYNTRWLFQASA